MCGDDQQLCHVLLAELSKDELPPAEQCHGPQADSQLSRRLLTARALYDQITQSGAHEAALADKFLDGSVAALERFVLCDEPSASTAYQSENAACKGESGASGGIDKRSAEELSYEAFFLQYMLPNRPVLIQGANAGWAAMRDWRCPDGSINMHFLASRFGDARVWVTDTGSDGQSYGSGRRLEMSLAEYAQYWADRQAGKDGRCLYLKDWHFASEFPSYKAYSCPAFFCDDWLNDYHCDLAGRQNGGEGGIRSQQDIITSDYRFVYLGPQGTATPIHADVLRSFSWSSNVVGRKRWRLLPPAHTPLLLDRFGREMAPSFDLAADPEAARRFPNLRLAAALAIEVDQGVGEALFVPSGWHHSVENTEDTLSINHNWLNGCSIHAGWAHLEQERADAVRAIEDCRELTSPAEFENLVQRNMAANCGLNLFSVSHFLGCIAARQLSRLQSCSCPERKQRLLEAFSLHRCVLVLQPLRQALAGAYGLPEAPSDESEVDSIRWEELDRLLGELQAAARPEAVVAALAALESAGRLAVQAVAKEEGRE